MAGYEKVVSTFAEYVQKLHEVTERNILYFPFYADCIIIVITQLKKGETAMADGGKKDKSKRENQKKASLNPKEKRKLKKEKKNK